MNNDRIEHSYADKVGQAVAEAFSRIDCRRRSESPEVVGRRIALALVKENLTNAPDAGEQVRRSYAKAAQAVALSSLEAGALIGMDETTYSGWRRASSLEAPRSDVSILGTAATLNQVEFIMGSEAGHQWLLRPCFLLDSRKPVDLIKVGQSALVARALDEIYLQHST